MFRFESLEIGLWMIVVHRRRSLPHLAPARNAGWRAGRSDDPLAGSGER